MQRPPFVAVVLLILAFSPLSQSKPLSAKEFKKIFYFRGSDHYYNLYKNGTVELIMTKTNSATIRSIGRFLYGYFSVWMKVPSGFSAGVISTFFMTSGGGTQDEIDLEFLGHINPRKIMLHTNVFGAGIGGKQEGFTLWFDPSKAFHKYTIWWSKDHVVWLVDDIAIRVYYRIDPKTGEENPYPNRPMYIHCSIWNGSVWATQGGLIKPDYSKGPFMVQYRNFMLKNACPYSKKRNTTCTDESIPRIWEKNVSKTRLNQIHDVRMKRLRYSYLAA